MDAIKLNYTGSREDTYSRMLIAITKADGKLEGDKDIGSFSIPVAVGRIDGEYVIEDNEIIVKIKKKPFIVSRKMIQEKLQEFLEA